MVPALSAISDEEQRAAAALVGDLRRVFGVRLQSVVAYGLDSRTPDGPLHTMALVDRLTFEDLAACAPLVRAWASRQLAVPLLLGRDEFLRSLDTFALEYNTIVADHVVLDGADPFAGVRIAESDLRRACERQAKSHLIHLREGFLESGGDARAVSGLLAESLPAFEALLVNIARLEGSGGSGAQANAEAARAIGLPAALLDDLLAARAGGTIVEPSALLARYVSAAERTWRYVDAWHAGDRPPSDPARPSR
ncbi:MAG TPA: hypothetical protein VD833_18220 [Vicinamibacterales bacterium]|nr:hypothetical protein [Vicinamibacterales bacterium]